MSSAAMIHAIFLIFIVLASADETPTDEPESPRIPCGLPPFADHLPEEKSAELRSIWSNWTAGEDCASQQQETFSIVASLNETEKVAIFGPRPQMQEDDFDNTPAFIRSLAPEIKKSFDEIWMSVDLKDSEKHDKLEEFAKTNFNKEQLADFTRWLTEVRAHKEAVDRRIANLSPPAKTLFNEIVEIRKQEQKLLKGMSADIAKELQGLI